MLDLSQEVIDHCMVCNRKDSNFCNVCFFGSIDIGADDFGSAYAYRRAFRYLKIIRWNGFRRNDTFGTRNILEGVTVK